MIFGPDTGFGVKALIFSGERALLLRKPNGEPDLTGGRLERGEDYKCALEREIFEETGLSEVEICGRFAEWTFINRQGLRIRGTTWVCHFVGGVVRLSFEHSGYTWTPLNELRGFGLFEKYALYKFGFLYPK